jgi:GH25 family lysozyme M1 (1,4-beta-N-acetylmuramidase)
MLYPVDIDTQLKEYVVAMTEDVFPVRGVDISRYNGVVDFGKLATKAQFVIIQAGYGANGDDSQYEANLKAALAHDLVPMIYWYLKPSKDWRGTADLFAQVWKDSPRIGYPWADLEQAENLDKQALMGWTEKFWRRFEDNIGHEDFLGCYTSPGFLNAAMGQTNWLKNKPLWVAHWTTAAAPTLPNEWVKINNPRTWTLWQWQVYKPGSDYGSGSSAMDLDRYNGTVYDFNAKFGTHIKPLEDQPTPPPPDPLPDKEYKPIGRVKVTAVGRRNIRAYPSTSTGKIIGFLEEGDEVPVYGLSADGLWYDCGGFWLYKSGTREV